MQQFLSCFRIIKSDETFTIYFEESGSSFLALGIGLASASFAERDIMRIMPMTSRHCTFQLQVCPVMTKANSILQRQEIYDYILNI